MNVMNGFSSKIDCVYWMAFREWAALIDIKSVLLFGKSTCNLGKRSVAR